MKSMVEKVSGDTAGSGYAGHPAYQQARLVTVVENRAEAVVITDVNGNIQYVNPEFERITGFSRVEVVDRGISVLGSGQHDSSFFRQMRESLNSGETWQGRFVITKKDDSLFESEVTFTPVLNKAGEITHHVGVQRDVTHEVQLEKQLRQAQKMEAIGTLAGGIAHDFNNLLMGIQGNISLSLSEIDSDSPLFENLKKVEQYVRNGVELTRKLLGFARGGKYELRLTDVNRLLKEQNLLFSRTNKSIVFKEDFEPKLWHVEADQDQIEQVLLNLYMNAFQAMPNGGTLTIRTENVTIKGDQQVPYRVKPGDYILLTVADTGTGMDEKTQRRIFDPFFTTKDMGRGTGLGMASVYGIIKNHEGFINVFSQEGRGTRFEIFLPARQKITLQSELMAEDDYPGKETVLLVDDEEMIVDVGQRMLDKLGYEVLTAMDGDEAIEVYQTHGAKINLVILDMVMPRASGGEVFDRLKQIDPEIKVILCSGYSINGEATEILNRGCNAFIQKPFDLQTLSQQVRAVLQNKS
jgi:PAS domain S-box-containing protein